MTAMVVFFADGVDVASVQEVNQVATRRDLVARRVTPAVAGAMRVGMAARVR